MTLAARIQQALSMIFGGGIPLSNRNGFIDPGFRQWTYGAANPATLLASGTTYVGPAMWKAQAGNGGAGTISAVDNRTSADGAFLESDETGPSYKISITTGSTGTVALRTAAAIFQNIENAARYEGRSVTLSFKLRVDSGSMTIPGVLAVQAFGSGGSPSSNVVFDKAVNWVVGTTLKKFSVRVDVPSTAGKTFGTAGGDFTQWGIWLPPGVTGNLTIVEPQIELCSPNSSPDLNGAGGSPTTFENRGAAAEDLRTARYYQLSDSPITGNNGNCIYSGNITSGGTYYAAIRFSPVMRATPAVTLSQNAQGGFNLANAGYTAGPDAYGFVLSNTAVSTATGAYFYGWLADARL